MLMCHWLFEEELFPCFILFSKKAFCCLRPLYNKVDITYMSADKNQCKYPQETSPAKKKN